jgi:hypothetical protein
MNGVLLLPPPQPPKPQARPTTAARDAAKLVKRRTLPAPFVPPCDYGMVCA